MAKPVEQLSQVIVRFAGDSGDGMQLTGSQFTSETALLGNDISTLPDFPAEIRAPAGSLPGVSGFQLHFADHDLLTPGDAPNVRVAIKPAKLQPGTYRNITGNQALSMGLVAASKLSQLPLFLGAYPITPASAILEELAGYKHFGVRTFQAEDEIAAAGAAVGASFGGMLGVTTSAGPGIVLKAETIGLAAMLELPLVICDIQRA